VKRIVDDVLDHQPKLTLTLAQSLRRLPLSGYVAANDINNVVLGAQRPMQPAPRLVLVPKTILQSDRRDACRQTCTLCFRLGRVLRMPQVASMHAANFFFAPTENPRPGWVHAGEHALKVGDAEQIVRNLPNAITLMHTLRDFCCQRL